MCIHSIWYWMVQRYVYRQPSLGYFEKIVPLNHRSSFRELTASTYTDIITFIHTVCAFHKTLISNAFNGIQITEPSIWVNSQYALELVIYIMTLLRAYWNPSAKPVRGLIVHHFLAFALLVSSYLSGMTNVGMLMITLTNSTNIAYDYFKYGLMVNHPLIKCISSVCFWSVFYTFRIYLLAQLVLIPFSFNVSISQLLYFAPMLYGLYALQLVWFYRITQITYNHTRIWVNSLFNLKDTNDAVREDFRQILDHLKTIETHIHKHIHSHTIPVSNENSETENEDDNTETDNKETSVQKLCEKLLTDKTLNEISDMADKIMDEALGQWRAIMLKQIKEFNTEIEPSTMNIETDKKED